jgi:2-methylcitrate dehydratase PrpD
VRPPEPAATRLARWSAALRPEEIPPAALASARMALLDAIACAGFGMTLPWTRILLDEVRDGGGGPCVLPGAPGITLRPREAALVLGAASHAFELDSLRKPGAGVHGGANVALPALAVAQAQGASGAELLTAIVAGIEVLFRIGAATLHTPEKRGHHAPGLTGPFGAAAAASRLMRLDAAATARAFGIAGSLGGGLLAFAKAETGGMVKRLHLGRAAEAGVLAASLAARGYEGPPEVLDGRFGLLEAYCDASDPALLTADLGQVWEIGRLCIKRYACHVTAQAPVELLREMMQAERFAAGDIAAIGLRAGAKVASHHAGAAPADLAQAQYSVPFSLAIAAHRDPADPRAFSAEALADPAIRSLAGRVAVTADAQMRGWGAELAITLRDGRVLRGRRDAFLGCPERPMDETALRAKLDRLLAHWPAPRRDALCEGVAQLERLDDIRDLPLG